jgi:Ca-activated chloride channel family protein
MSFAAPLWLAGLALIPVAIAVAVGARRRARRYSIRFTAVSTARLAVIAGPRWPRHIPAAALLASIAALTLALARPRVSYSSTFRYTSIMLVSDESGSMAATDVNPSRLVAAENAANTLIDHLPSGGRIGAISFSDAPNQVQSPGTGRGGARAVIDDQRAHGGTDTGGALELALQLLHGARQGAAVVLLSDGAANEGPNPIAVAREAAREKIPIYTVALGTPAGMLPSPDPFTPPQLVPPDPELMRQIAQTSHGRSFDAQTADRLESIYKQLAARLGTKTRQRDITAEVAIAGLAFLLLAAAGSALWSPRLP